MSEGKSCKCGQTLATNSKVKLCLKCQADKLTDVCKINKFGYKKIEYTTMTMTIPYCFKDEKEILIGGMSWRCDKCQHGKRGE